MAVASIAQAHASVRVIVGVDTHKDSHVRHAKDELGRDLGHLEVPTTARGYAALLSWARNPPRASAEKVEMIRSLRIARTLATKARTQAINAVQALVVMAPEGGSGRRQRRDRHRLHRPQRHLPGLDLGRRALGHPLQSGP